MAEIEFLNLAEFEARAVAAIAALKADGEARLEETARSVVADAVALAPVSHDPSAEPGKLRASIAAQVDSDGAIRVGSFDCDFNAFVEFGTSRQRAEPYLRPALAIAKI